MATVTDRFLAHAEHLPDPNASMASHWLAGLLHYELNDLEAAGRHFSRAWDSRYLGNFMSALNSGLGLVRLHQLYGELEEAQDLLDSVRHSAQQLKVEMLLRDLEAFQAEQWLFSGETLAALRWLKSWANEAPMEPRIRFQLRSLIAARIAAAIGAPDEIGVTLDMFP